MAGLDRGNRRRRVARAVRGVPVACGLDVVFPCFFLLLLLDALKSRPDHRWVGLGATAIAGAAVLLLVGVALLASAAATFLALLPRRGRW